MCITATDVQPKAHPTHTTDVMDWYWLLCLMSHEAARRIVSRKTSCPQATSRSSSVGSLDAVLLIQSVTVAAVCINSTIAENMKNYPLFSRFFRGLLRNDMVSLLPRVGDVIYTSCPLYSWQALYGSAPPSSVSEGIRRTATNQ